MADGVVIHEPDQSRFSLSLNGYGEPAVLDYLLLEEGGATVYNLTHTYVPPQMRGKGIAAKLVKFACAHARAHATKIIPTCSYVPLYLSKNKDDLDVVRKD